MKCSHCRWVLCSLPKNVMVFCSASIALALCLTSFRWAYSFQNMFKTDILSYRSADFITISSFGIQTENWNHPKMQVTPCLSIIFFSFILPIQDQTTRSRICAFSNMNLDIEICLWRSFNSFFWKCGCKLNERKNIHTNQQQ